MSKKEQPALLQAPLFTEEFYRLKKLDRNHYTVETLTVQGDKIVKREQTEPSYLVSAFDTLRRKTGEEYLKALNHD